MGVDDYGRSVLMTKFIVRGLCGLLLVVMITGCVTPGQRRAALTGEVIENESSGPLGDVYLAVTYGSGASASYECAHVAVVKTTGDGHFSVPTNSKVNNASIVDITPYKRGYIFIAFDHSNPHWPVELNQNKVEVAAEFIGQDLPLPAIKMYKNNMTPQERLNYVDLLMQRGTGCTENEQYAGFTAVVEEEVADLQSTGVVAGGSQSAQWYGPGIDGVQRRTAALKPKRKPVVRTHSSKKILNPSPEQIKETSAWEERRKERRRKLDEILQKSQ